MDDLVFAKAGKRGHSRRTKRVSMHDLTHRYFRKPVVVLSRLDMFRYSYMVLLERLLVKTTAGLLILLLSLWYSTLYPPWCRLFLLVSR